jgi:hypothetical protein
MKKRHELPLMAKLNIQIDHERLVNEFYEFGYDNWDLYNGLKYGAASADGLVVRRVLLEYFLTDKEKEERKDLAIAEGGEAYKMLCLTQYNGDEENDSRGLVELAKNMNPHALARKFEKISDPNHPMYVPVADEKKYDKRTKYAKGYVAEIMDMLEEKIGHVARSRYAVLMPGEEIKPHLDINTDKAIRIHIPVITNNKVTIGVEGKRRIVEQHYEEGSVWFLNQGYSHWVRNDGDTPRVHLVFVITGQNGLDDALEVFEDSYESEYKYA